jgi:proteasome accessory factor B
MAQGTATPSSRPPLARMMRIHEELQAGRLTNGPKLARQLEVSTKTVARDLAFMRDQLGLPLEYDPKIYSWRYAYPVKNFPTVQVSEGELLALLVAQKALELYRGTPYHDQLAHAFDKLATGLKDQISFSPAGSLANVSFHQLGPSKSDLKIFEQLSRAVLRGFEIELTYRKAQSRTAETRRLQPYHLANRENAWYVVGFDQERGALRSFAVSRIERVAITAKRFAKPTEFSAEQYFAASFGAYVGSGEHRVVIRFQPSAAAQIRERFWHESQVTVELPDGGVELRLNLSSLAEVQRWALSWAEQAEVVSPPELRDRVTKSVKAMAKQY